MRDCTIIDGSTIDADWIVLAYCESVAVEACAVDADVGLVCSCRVLQVHFEECWLVVSWFVVCIGGGYPLVSCADGGSSSVCADAVAGDSAARACRWYGAHAAVARRVVVRLVRAVRLIARVERKREVATATRYAPCASDAVSGVVPRAVPLIVRFAAGVLRTVSVKFVGMVVFVWFPVLFPVPPLLFPVPFPPVPLMHSG